ncbi:MAG: hypothetical protein JXA07_12710 [Spirochaetes bacterium]|nr:hypothetical protein [Spirochaetota bacterium]
MSKKNENVRKYLLKIDRAKIKLQEINDEFLLTAPGAELWQLTRDQIAARLDRLPGELLAAVKDHRSSPGEAQAELQRVVYAALSEIAAGVCVDRADRQFRKGRA